MLKFIARLARPIVEEAIEQIYARRAAQADAAGISGMDRIFFKVLGGDPQEPELPPEREKLHTIRKMRSRIKFGLQRQCV